MSIRLLGIDPGLRATGWGVVDAAGNLLSAVANGTVRTDGKAPLAERLHVIFFAIKEIIREYDPQECAIEEIFVNKNSLSTLKLGHARAAAMLAGADSNLPVSEYAPNAVKKAVVGAGHADKQQIGAMVRMLLPGHTPESEDAADALAVAICHAHHRVSAERLTKAIAGGQSS